MQTVVWGIPSTANIIATADLAVTESAMFKSPPLIIIISLHSTLLHSEEPSDNNVANLHATCFFQQSCLVEGGLKGIYLISGFSKENDEPIEVLTNTLSLLHLPLFLE